MEYIRRNDQTIMAADATIPPASRAQQTGMWLTAQERGKSLGALAAVGPQAFRKGTTRGGLQRPAPRPSFGQMKSWNLREWTKAGDSPEDVHRADPGIRDEPYIMSSKGHRRPQTPDIRGWTTTLTTNQDGQTRAYGGEPAMHQAGTRLATQTRGHTGMDPVPTSRPSDGTCRRRL